MFSKGQTAINVKNGKEEALSNDLVLRRIIGFLPITDKRSCRLVNSTWLDAANSDLRKSMTNRPTIDNYSAVQSFLDLWERDDEKGRPRPPFTKISLDLTNMCCKDKETHLRRFLRTVAPFVAELKLHVSLTNPVYIVSNEEGDEGLSYPNLTNYCVVVKGYTAKSRVIYKLLSCGILENSPNLCHLAYHGGFTDDVNSSEYFHWVIDTLKGRKWGHKKIKSLEIKCGMEEAHYSRMVDELSELKLETFKVDNDRNFSYVGVDESGFFRFLQSQGESLKFLGVCRVTGCFENVGIPIMKKLETLQVENWRPLYEFNCVRGMHADGEVTLRQVEVVPNLDYSKQLPALKNLFFDDFFKNDAWMQFMPRHGSPPVASVEVLKFLSNVVPTVNMEHCIGTFQNLRILQIPVTRVLANLVYEYLPQLEELILDTSYFTNIDGIITGFSSEDCAQVNQYTEDEMNLWLVSKGPMVHNHKPISVLKNLKVLRLVSEFRPNKVELTKVSSRLILGKMKSLQILDFGKRSSIALERFAEVIIDMENAGKKVQYESDIDWD